MTEMALPVPTWCIPADTSCCDWDEADPGYSDEERALAVALAESTFVMLTGYRVGACPVAIRPCLKRCGQMPTWASYPLRGDGATGPYIEGGRWFNGCGCTGDCSCTTLCEVILPGEAHGVTEVMLDGVAIDPDGYVLHYPNRLVRTDGDCWPSCQDLTAAPDEVGSFVVTYRPGPAPNALDSLAVGRLACEYAKACRGGKCALPSGAVTIARQGVTVTLADKDGGLFPGGLTGIREVDHRIRFWNPHALKSPSLVWSPDAPRSRRSM